MIYEKSLAHALGLPLALFRAVHEEVAVGGEGPAGGVLGLHVLEAEGVGPRRLDSTS